MNNENEGELREVEGIGAIVGEGLILRGGVGWYAEKGDCEGEGEGEGVACFAGEDERRKALMSLRELYHGRLKGENLLRKRNLFFLVLSQHIFNYFLYLTDKSTPKITNSINRTTTFHIVWVETFSQNSSAFFGSLGQNSFLSPSDKWL